MGTEGGPRRIGWSPAGIDPDGTESTIMKPRLAPLGAIALAIVVLAPPAFADSGGGRRSVTLHARSVNSGPIVQHAPACDATGQCIASYSAPNAVSGDLTGTLAVEGILHLVVGQTVAKQGNVQLFSGTVAGCGSGTFVVQLPLQPISFTAPSVSTGAKIIQGSGTGGLIGISGGGKQTFTPDPQGGGVGDLAFKIRCRPG